MTVPTNQTDTIAAIATPNGAGGVGIVRIAGPQALSIAFAITKKKHLPHQLRFYNSFSLKMNFSMEA